MANIRHTTEQWQHFIDEQPQSGLTVKAYCAQRNITVSGFYLWRKKLAKPSATSEPDANWLSLTPAASAERDNWQIELSLPGGVVLRMNGAK